MGTGEYVNFSNKGNDFNIELDTAGHLNFRAKGHSGDGNRRMSILDDQNTVSFDGSMTVVHAITAGGTGFDGALQLRAADGDNTVYLGSSDSETTVQVGSQGRPGELHLYDSEHSPTFSVYGDQALLTLGADGQAGDLFAYDSGGKTALSMTGSTGQLGLHVDGQRTITLDGAQAKVTVGSTANGVVDIKDSAGTVRIRLSADTASIEFFDKTGKSTGTLP